MSQFFERVPGASNSPPPASRSAHARGPDSARLPRVNPPSIASQEAAALVRAKRGLPRVDPHTRFEDDPVCQQLIAERGAMDLSDIGACLDICRERARQIEESALRRFARGLGKQGPELREHIREILARRVAEESRTSREDRTLVARLTGEDEL